MSRRTAVLVLAALVVLTPLGCTDPLGAILGSGSIVHIKLVNTSQTQFVSPDLGVCPNSIAEPPHHFVDPPPVLAPGEELTLTTTQVAGLGGDCITFSTDFMIGLCGWQYGPDADSLASTTQRFGGQIGFQFECGDTVILRWTDTGAAGGTWTSEVESAPGNEPPSAAFQLM